MEDISSWSQVLEDLQHKLSLKRQEASSKVLRFSQTVAENTLIDDLIHLCSNTERWEARHGGFLALQTVCNTCQPASRQRIYEIVKQHLSDSETSVRLAAAELAGILACVDGTQIYAGFQSLLYEMMETNLQRAEDIELANSSIGSNSDHIISPASHPCSLATSSDIVVLASSASTSRNGCRQGFSHSPVTRPQLNMSMVSPESKVPSDTSPHSPISPRMRFVHTPSPPTSPRTLATKDPRRFFDSNDLQILRNEAQGWRLLETALVTVSTVLRNCGPAASEFVDDYLIDLVWRCSVHANTRIRERALQFCACICQVLSSGKLREMSKHIVRIIAGALLDLSSPVRFAACNAARAFMVNAHDFREEYYNVLIPPMCFTRYDVAEGVSQYALVTWTDEIGDAGIVLVESNISQIVECYLEQLQSAESGMRESACYCLTELASKVKPEAVLPYFSKIVAALLLRCNDESPIRDPACRAASAFLVHFTDNARPVLNDFLSCFFRNVADENAAVRDASAAALSDVARAFGPEVPEQVVNYTQSQLTRAPELRQAEPHSPAANSIAGACCLLRELSKVLPANVIPLVPQFARLVSDVSPTLNPDVLTVAWKCLPIIAQGIGKRPFQRELQAFIDPLFHSLTGDNRLLTDAAGDCIEKLAKFVGLNIFRGRLTPEQVELMDTNALIDLSR